MNHIHAEAIQKLRQAQLKEGHSKNTRDSYRGWVIQYREARISKQCQNLQKFLDLLIYGDRRVSPATIHQAVCALVFYHRNVLGIVIPPESLHFPRRNRHRNHPDIPTHQEVMDLFSHMRGLPLLQAELLYGTSARITALLSLRLKDIDLIRGTVSYRFDKGGKTRTIPLPRTILPKLHAHIAVIRQQWTEDHARGIHCPIDPPSLARKIGTAKLSTLPWYWLFPSSSIRGKERWHTTSKALSSSIDLAAKRSGIMRRITPHTLRHASATALLERGENPRRIQEHLGHTHLETTEIYLHATATDGLSSPLDAPPTHPRILSFPVAIAQ